MVDARSDQAGGGARVVPASTTGLSRDGEATSVTSQVRSIAGVSIPTAGTVPASPGESTERGSDPVWAAEFDVAVNRFRQLPGPGSCTSTTSAASKATEASTRSGCDGDG